MAMMSSLDSGVSGLTTSQSMLNTIANNLANVNTSGFKGSNVSFATALTQTQYSGSSPNGTTGGRNPLQSGLGVSTSALAINMNQGALQSTGRNLDAAIQGEGFFQLSNGQSTYFTRVGNFGLDADKNLVDLGSGNKVIGNLFDPASQTTPIAYSVPLVIPNTPISARGTSEIRMLGNLNSATPAIQGTSVQSVFPLTDAATGETATVNTLLNELSIFKLGVAPSIASGNPQDDIRMVHLFGTKPDGTGWTGDIALNPWQDSVSDLVSKINASLTSGSASFAQASVSNGNVVINSIGTGKGFSCFMGDAITTGSSNEVTLIANAVAGLTNTTLANGSAFAGTSTETDIAVDRNPTANGSLNPTFIMPASDYSGAAFTGKTLTISVYTAAAALGARTLIGQISIPAADYSATGANRTFSLSALPEVATTDFISYTIDGDLSLPAGTPAGRLLWSTQILDRTATDTMVADANGDGTLNMFDAATTGVANDPNAWQYSTGSNSVFNWYQVRAVPGVVTSSLQVYDSQGGSHVLETRMFRNGTKADPTNLTAKRTNWDMIVSVPPNEGTLADNVVAGMEFDQNGNFTGAYGSTLKGNALNDVSYVGGPSSRTIQITWNTTGTTTPATIDMSLGDSNSVTGLTSFGSSSSAAAQGQNGYSSGELSGISIDASGNIMGQYTNGVNSKLAQLALATFSNPSGLINAGSNLWTASSNSGTAVARTAGNSAGTITAGALEGSNIDIATEFTKLITAQRGFQVNAKVIQTTDQILQVLTGIVQ